MQRHRGNVTIVGIDVLSGCKEPSKQFALVEEHIAALRKNLYRTNSRVTVIVERNLVSITTLILFLNFVFNHYCVLTYNVILCPKLYDTAT
jgi:hypothetical protein